MEGIQSQEPVGALGLGQPLAHGGDCAAVLVDRAGGLNPLTGLAAGAGAGPAAAAPQGFAVKGEERTGVRSQSWVLPSEQPGLEALEVDGGPGAWVSAFGGDDGTAGMSGLAAAAQSARRRFAQCARELGEVTLSQEHAPRLGRNQEAQHRAPGMPPALGLARIGPVLGQWLQQTGQAAGGHAAAWAWRRRFLFENGPLRRERGGAPGAPGLGFESAAIATAWTLTSQVA